METKELTEGNEIIAVFMGFIPKKTELGNTYTHPDKMGVYGGVGMKFKYDTSWDWLIPACKQWSEIPDELTPYLWDRYHLVTRSMYESISTFDLIEVFKQLVYNIKWYNDKIRPR